MPMSKRYGTINVTNMTSMSYKCFIIIMHCAKHIAVDCIIKEPGCPLQLIYQLNHFHAKTCTGNFTVFKN